MRIKTLAAFGAALILAACGNPSQEEAIAGNNFDSSESDSSDATPTSRASGISSSLCHSVSVSVSLSRPVLVLA